MYWSYLFLTVAFLSILHFIKQVDSLPANEVVVYLDCDSSNLRGKVSLSINGDPPQLLEASYADWRTSSVICRHLGAGPPILTLSTSYNSDGYYHYYSINHIQCTGWETVLTDCKIDFTRSSILFSPKVMEVKCAPSFATDFEVLFVQPFEDSHQGIVLTYLDGRWGPVVGNTSNSNEVICKEMGQSPGEDLHRGSSGVQVFAHPVIKNLTCRGNERRLEECSYSKLDNHTYHSLGRDPVYVAACTDHFYDGEIPTLYAYGVDEYPSYPQGIHSSSFVSVLTIIVLMSVSLVICLRCGLGGEHSDNESAQIDLGNSSEVRHIYQGYHAGTGSGYQQVPCTIYQAPPVQRNPVRPPSLPSRKLSERGPGDPPSYDTSVYLAGSNTGQRTEPGRGYTSNLEHYRGCYPGYGAPSNNTWYPSTDHDHQVESIDGYHPGSGPEYSVHPLQSTTPHELSATTYQPGSGVAYPSVPESTPEGTMTGSTSPVSGWTPTIGFRGPLGDQHSADFGPPSSHSGLGNDPSDPDLPSYSEAVFRSSFQS